MKTLRLSLFWLMILMTIFSFAQSNLIERGSKTLSTLTRKAPYLIYTGNNTEIQLLWQLTTTDTCTIEWGTDTLYVLGSVETTEYGNSHQHTYTITNLEPGTKYYMEKSIAAHSAQHLLIMPMQLNSWLMGIPVPTRIFTIRLQRQC
jgi:hypothetical protein